jgi:hypothetical protein
MFKRILMVAAVGLAGLCLETSRSEAGIVYRPIAPVRRVAGRAVLPPYPVARRVVTTPVYAPYYGPAYGYSPVIYGSPYYYGSGVSIVVGY